MLTTVLKRKETDMATTMVNVRMDEETKRGMESVCKELGMSMSTAFNIFAKKMGREHRIPFEVSVDPFYSEENIAHLKRSIQDLDRGRSISHQLVEDE